ncbi:MAG: NUDIX domain-containing protein [Anaerolineales bacterium]
MRIRAGIVLLEEQKVVLIERFRAGMHYYVFPGGGVEEGESPEQAALREMQEETGLHVAIRRKVAEIHFGMSTQHYFLAERVDGVFGTGQGEEYTAADPDDPLQGIYIPVWMSLPEVARHENIYPADVAALAVKSLQEGWPATPIVVEEAVK